MSNQNFFVNKFLYFLDKNTEDFFHDSLIYIFEHDQNGALGIIINKTIDIGENKIFSSLNIESLKNKSKFSEIAFSLAYYLKSFSNIYKLLDYICLIFKHFYYDISC